jgi:single-stranded-DNA-specific exonuclease
VHTALQHCASHLTSFGGHAMAAGLRLQRARLDAFRDDFVAFVNTRLSAEELTPVLEIDADCGLPDVTMEMVDQVQTLAPFGRDNPAPVLCVKNVQLAECARRIGNGGEHLRLHLRENRTLMQAVGWRLGDLAERLPSGLRVDVAFEPKVNTWDGRRRPDLHVKDIRIVS